MSKIAELPAGILFGAAYYHEYMPYARLDADLDLMQAAHFTVIRVGESVWSTWEPEDGVFNLEWLEPILDGAHRRGISVVIGTPSYAVPPWLRRKCPETTAQRSTGQPIPYGGRQNVDFASPAYRHLVERLVRRIVGRYAEHPAAIGWQVDNEPGVVLLHNPSVFEGFIDELRTQYGEEAALNERWGLTYWSHRISRWDELWPPDGNTNPCYALAWRRYQARLTADFIAWQAGIVRELARNDQFVTTCLDMDTAANNNVETIRRLDLTAANIYVPTQEGLTQPVAAEPLLELTPWWTHPTGPFMVAWRGDRARGARQESFLVTETNAQSTAGHAFNYPAYDGQWRQIAWTLVARGARMIEYWHWHSIHHANETYWHGILGHSLEPGRCYEELKRLGAEFDAASGVVAGLEPDAEIAVLVSADSQWALEFQPPLVVPGSQTPDTTSYTRIFGAFYRGFFDAGLSAAIFEPGQLDSNPQALAERWPVLVAPAVYIASDELLALLVAYAGAGGHLVLTPRTGYADAEGRMRAEVMPGALRAAAGLRYLEYTNLTRSVKVEGLCGNATGWVDALEVEGAEVLATHDHPHLRGWPAVTSHVHGKGRVTCCGTIPDPELGSSLAHWIAETSLPANPWRLAGGAVTSMGARNRQGRRLRFLANWSWEPAQVEVPECVQDVLNRERFEAGASLPLGPWDVRVLVAELP